MDAVAARLGWLATFACAAIVASVASVAYPTDEPRVAGVETTLAFDAGVVASMARVRVLLGEQLQVEAAMLHTIDDLSRVQTNAERDGLRGAMVVGRERAIGLEIEFDVEWHHLRRLNRLAAQALAAELAPARAELERREALVHQLEAELAAFDGAYHCGDLGRTRARLELERLKQQKAQLEQEQARLKEEHEREQARERLRALRDLELRRRLAREEVAVPRPRPAIRISKDCLTHAICRDR